MQEEFLRVATKDKLILQGLLYKPNETTDKAILHIHGMAGNFYENRFLDSMARQFTENGWAFLPGNTRGHDFIADFPVAGKKEDYKRIGNFREKFEECIHDICVWIDLIESRGYKYIVLQGHSLGCSKAVYYFTKTQDNRIKKLILASPTDMVGWAESEKNHKELLSMAEKMIADGKGQEILPQLVGGEYYLSAETYINFTKRGNPIDIFNFYNKDKSSILSEIKIPTLTFFGSNDGGSVSLSSKEALEIIKTKAINCPQFDTNIINGAPHSYFGHEDEVVNIIINWLEK